MKRFSLLTLVSVVSLCPPHASADPGTTVQIPLADYQTLTGGQNETPRGPGFAIGTAQVSVVVAERDGRSIATVTASLVVRVIRSAGTLVPLLPNGTALASATAGGEAVGLVAAPGGLCFAPEAVGAHRIELVYEVEASRFAHGASISIPLPRAAASRISASVAGTGIGLALMPAVAPQIVEANGQSTITATVADAAAVQLSWRDAFGETGYTLSRASYQGVLEGEAVRFTAELGVELTGSESATIPLMPSTVALGSLQVDGQEASIAIVDERFAVHVRGRGRHVIRATFDVRVEPEEGLPAIQLDIPAVPVSRFEISLPGEKELTTEPATPVRRTTARGRTLASFFLPMTDHVSVRWPEAVPTPATSDVEARANAAVYHIAHAEEGVLALRAVVVVEVTRGQLSQFTLDVPDGALVNGVRSAAGEVADWRVEGEHARVLSVFLDRAIEGEFTFDVDYEVPTAVVAGAAAPLRPVSLPVLAVRNVHRQRGMVALLSTRELTLQPSGEVNLTRIGENQLPSTVRDGITDTVAHTFRYVDAAPRLSVTPAAREREAGRFDAEVDTLVSLADATITGSATISVHVKSGSITELDIPLPEGVSFLDLTAPSLRQHRMVEEGGRHVVHVEFTQEMEGDFRVQLSYERIFPAGRGQVTVPAPHVDDADVEQGRIAIEALAAVQVDAASVVGLSPVEVAELPEQLVMRTTNPILLAYKYTHVTPLPVLALRVTRHQEVATQDATIDDAQYRTLFTADGLAVTTVVFRVRNQRKQFLQIALPAGSEVWAARVNGRPQTPASATGSTAAAPAVLLNIIHSTTAFPVELVYATRSSAIGWFGRVRSTLPRPDVIVTRSHWEVFLPEDADYGEPDGDLTVVSGPTLVDRSEMGDVGNALQGLPIAVPGEGVRFVLEQLYASEGTGESRVSIPYTSGWGTTTASVLALVGTLLAWLGLLGLGWAAARRLLPASASLIASQGRAEHASRGAIAGLSGMAFAGIVVLAMTVGYLATSAVGPVLISLAIAGCVAAFLVRERLGQLFARAKTKLGGSSTTPAVTFTPPPAPASPSPEAREPDASAAKPPADD